MVEQTGLFDNETLFIGKNCKGIDEKSLKAQISDSGFFSRQCEIEVANESFKVLEGLMHL